MGKIPFITLQLVGGKTPGDFEIIDFFLMYLLLVFGDGLIIIISVRVLSIMWTLWILKVLLKGEKRLFRLALLRFILFQFKLNMETSEYF